MAQEPYTPHHWQTKPQEQLVDYPDGAQLQQILAELSQLQGLITSDSIALCKKHLHQAALGQRFILQGGDCAESFAAMDQDSVTKQFNLLLQMSLTIAQGQKVPVTSVGRIAGQYAKPRTALIETQQGESLPSYRGDLLNAKAFDKHQRRLDPTRLLTGYHLASMTLRHLNELSVKSSEIFGQQEFFTSHEGLNLYYEQALTRKINNNYYNLSVHFPWIGMRTSQLGGAHVEYFRGIENPIGIKVGPNADSTWLINLIRYLNPNNSPGKITLITRLGMNQVFSHLPTLIKAVKQKKLNVLWMCDPMHGNTRVTQSGIKTRYCAHIQKEMSDTFLCHTQHHSHCGGVHLELTGDAVTECIGGANDIQLEDLNKAYKSLVDPRLNYQQALEMAMLLATAKKSVNIPT